jgi:hypothetical protein
MGFMGDDWNSFAGGRKIPRLDYPSRVDGGKISFVGAVFLWEKKILGAGKGEMKKKLIFRDPPQGLNKEG